MKEPAYQGIIAQEASERETDPTLLGSENVAADDILAIGPDARAKNGIAVSFGIPDNA
jgi:hypothetical protein